MLPSIGLPANHHIASSENALAPTIPHAPNTHPLRPQRLQHARPRHLPNLLHQPSKPIRKPKEPRLEPKNQPPIAPIGSLARVAIDAVPPLFVRGPALRHVLCVVELEPRRVERRQPLRDREHVCHAVAALDALAYFDVGGVRRVELARHEPLVGAEDAAGLEHACDFRVAGCEVRGVDCGFGAVDKVEVVVREGDLLRLRLAACECGRRENGAHHEVTDFVVAELGEALIFGISGRSVNVDLIDADAGDVCVGEEGNLSRRTTSTTATV